MLFHLFDIRQHNFLSIFIHVTPPWLFRENPKSKLLNVPDLHEEFSNNFYTLFNKSPWNQRKSPWCLYETYHMYESFLTHQIYQ